MSTSKKYLLGALILLASVLFFVVFVPQYALAQTPPCFLLKWGSTGSGDGQFNAPGGIAIDSSNNVYVVDKSNHRIQKFTSTGGFITKWGSSGSGDGQFNVPIGVAVDSSNNVYVSDSGNNRVQKFASCP